jgi:HSP20 family protein
MKQTSRWVDPFDLVSDLQDDMNRLFSSSLRRSPHTGFGDFFPSLEVKEDENQFSFHLDVPGMERKDLDISVTGNTLTIKGERKEEESKKGKGYFYSERKYGSFQRSVELPVEVDADKVTANYKDGVLELLLPKSEKAKPKQIKVDVK